MAAPRGAIATVALLGSAQTLAWASSYYLPAMLATPMARDLGVTAPTVFAAFSLALLVSAALGPFAGRAIDRWGGRPVLVASNWCSPSASPASAAPDRRDVRRLVLLASAWPRVTRRSRRWCAPRPRIAQPDHQHHPDRRLRQHRRLALSALLETQVGWRGACFAWAALLRSPAAQPALPQRTATAGGGRLEGANRRAGGAP
jgi:hypothetical protein